jgi:hypothetical protein
MYKKNSLRLFAGGFLLFKDLYGFVVRPMLEL